METLLTITDVTRMGGERVCVASVNEEGKSIRPVFQFGGIPESWLYQDGRCIIRPFAQVSLDLIEQQPQPPHTEDWIIDSNKKVFHQLLDFRQRRRVLQKIIDPCVASIFGTEIFDDHGFYVLAGEGSRSLGTVFARFIRAVKHRCRDDKWEYRIGFDDCAGHTYWLQVTDLSFRYYVDHLREEENIVCDEIGKQLTRQLRRSAVFLRIGLARGWNKFPDRCYLQITGVYTFPDYLHGRCFADYCPQRAEDIEIPF